MANKILKIDETAIIFGSEGGDDVAWTTESVANNAGRQSAHHDLGAGGTARAFRFMYRFYTQLQATPTLKQAVRILIKSSDGTHHDNDDGTGDIAVSAEDKLLNLRELKPAIVDEAAANIETVSSGLFEHYERYIAAVLWNQSGATITSDASETKLVITPVPDEIQ